MKTKRFVICQSEGCDTVFGGPTSGFDDAWRINDIKDEAISMGWVNVTITNDEYLFCTMECAAKWLKDSEL